MDRVEGHEDIHTLYGPRSRVRSFPQADYRFLVHAAANLARAFSAVHECGVVIGDVNDKFALVSNRATVRLIDCDSFQVRAGQRYFLCHVGVPTYQPPEMHEHDTYEGVVRTANHDNFGLAVLVFQLLFLARHPFAGRPLGRADLPIERAIREGRFPYGSDAAACGVAPPPHTLSLGCVSPEVSSLFSRAFSNEGARGKRPRASDWVTSLESLLRSLRSCATNPQHQFLDSLRSCPLCAIESGSGTLLFVGHAPSVAIRGTADISLQVAVLWRAIEAVRPPAETSPPKPEDFSVQARPMSGDGMRFRRFLSVALGIAAVISLPTGFGPFVLGLLAFLVWPKGASPEVQRRQQERAAARSDYEALLGHLAREGGRKEFQETLRRLSVARGQIEKFDGYRKQEQRRVDRETWLQAHLLRRRKIKGIGPALTSTLESFGVETAADVSAGKVEAVPGIGPARAKELMAWRRDCERRFDQRHDPSRPPDPNARKRLDAKLARERDELLRVLREGPAKLEYAARRSTAQGQNLEPKIRDAARRLAQANADAGH
jgi:DNA-binding helix-hairpin-helix protein with protein kinase domain